MRPAKPISSILLALFTAALALTAPARPESVPLLVHDVNRTPLHEGMVAPGAPFIGGREIDGVLYFAARDRAHGNELWRTDGSEEGTWLVDDLCPGPCSSNPRPQAALGDRLLFTADDGVHGAELWSTGGGRGDAELIHEATRGPGHSHYSVTADFAEIGGTVLFGVDGALWRTDGTAEGTRPALEPGIPIWGTEVARLGSYLYFPVTTQEDGFEIWRSDGTAEGTSVVSDFCHAPCDSRPTGLIALGNGIYFRTRSEVWTLDPESGEIVRLATVAPGSELIAAAWQGAVYFADGARLLRTDGTAERTREVARAEAVIRHLAALPEALLLAGYEAVWSFTQDGTAPVSLSQGQIFRTSVESPLTPVGDRVFFRVAECVGPHYCDRTRVSELWVSDGTLAGTDKVLDLCGGVVSCRNAETGVDRRGSAAVGDLYLFVVDSSKTGSELWRSDGTAAGTRILADIWTDPGSTAPELLPVHRGSVSWQAPVAVGDRLAFPALVSAVENRAWLSEYQLWSTGRDGGATPAGPVASKVGGLAVLGDALLFDQESELWRFDAGLGAIEVLNGSTWPGRVLAVHRDHLYFARGGCQDEFWRSDGTAGGTQLLAEFQGEGCEVAPWGQAIPGPTAALGSGVAFYGTDGYGDEIGLWLADEAGDVRLLAEVSINPGAGYPRSAAMARTGGRIVFAGAGNSGAPHLGRELWASDGTAAGTGPIADLRPGEEGSQPHDVIPFSGEVAFVAAPNGSQAGESLWISDGTGPGTRRVSDLREEDAPAWATHLTTVGDRLFFVATDEHAGPELWTSDGTAAGTRRVADLRPGPRGSYPGGLTAVGELLIFSADDGATGVEAWVSDGTEIGTRRLFDLAPGRAASTPSDFTPAGDLLYFWADEPVHGRELRALPLTALESPGTGGSHPPPPPGAWLATSGLPGFRAKARVTPAGGAPLAGRRAEDCIAETLCVEGALAARPEAFLKVIGPRPNGFLWVQVSRFTPSEIELWVEQLSSGEVNYYRLPAVGPGDTDVPGLQDRRAFTP